MSIYWIRISTGVFLLTVFVAGCAGPKASTGRLYNLKSGAVITVHFQDFYEGRGALSATMPDGEQVTGEYRIAEREHTSTELLRPAIIAADRSEAETLESSRTNPDQPPRSWPEVYGFGPNSEVEPVGTAVAVGDRGTVLEIVLYSVNLRDGDGDGVGRDNKGHWYRVQVGDLR
jgi:hypothetical protein